MLDPAPTTKIDPSLARGRLEEMRPETATKPAFAVVTFPNTDYRMSLEPSTNPDILRERLGRRVIGTIRAKARRVDVVGSGGRYVEPVIGRPRRVQGSVVAVDESKNTITVNAGVPIACQLTDKRQRSADFEAGMFVSFDVERGASFKLER